MKDCKDCCEYSDYCYYVKDIPVKDFRCDKCKEEKEKKCIINKTRRGDGK